METTKQNRLLEIFFRALRGEALSIQKLASEYGVSAKSVTRTVNDIKSFLADHRDLVGNAELQYSQRDKGYRLHMDEFLTNKELFALVEVMIGARPFSKMELLALIDKLKRFTTPEDRPILSEMIRKELYHYTEVKHDCESVKDTLWQLVTSITDNREITIEYYRMDRTWVTHRLRPVSVMFADYYFYLIAYRVESDTTTPLYFRVDRIKHIIEHRKKIAPGTLLDFDEGLLRQRSLFMWPGELRTIRFEFTGPSVQAVLDKLPTAKIIERDGGAYLIEAEVYGDGVKMWLLSQGAWVKVVAPSEFVKDMRETIMQMKQRY